MAYGDINADVLQSSTTGTAPVFRDGSGNQIGTLCRAWVQFDGTATPGTIRASFNVSSVSRNASADYTVNFTTAFSDANYSINGTAGGGSSNAIPRLIGPSNADPTTSGVRVVIGNDTGAADPMRFCSIAIFR